MASPSRPCRDNSVQSPQLLAVAKKQNTMTSGGKRAGDCNTVTAL